MVGLRSPARAVRDGVAGFAALLALWWIAAGWGWVNAFLLPPPGRVFGTALDLAANGSLARHVVASLRRIGGGYLLAVAVALPTAFLFGVAPRLRALIDPVLEFARQVPPLAMMPLLILWLGIGETQKVGIIFLACFFPIFMGAVSGIAQSDPKLIEVGRACGLSRAAILRRIVLPGAAPALVLGLRISLGHGWRALVGAELIASAAGLGYLVIDAQNLARTDIVVVGILVIGTLGLAADAAFRLAVAKAAPWLAARTELGHAAGA